MLGPTVLLAAGTAVFVLSQPACGQCLALPICPSFEVEVEDCPDGATCHDETACGTTITCMAEGPCSSSGDCNDGEYCSFPDGKCGAGKKGECKLQPQVCSDGPTTCMCGGAVTDLGCPGQGGFDIDATGTHCTPAPTAISCAQLVCDGGTADYCEITADDTGGPPLASCGQAPTGCDPATCACLTDATTACGGTCTDGPNGPTIHCPGG
jgi:hypothetical protein